MSIDVVLQQMVIIFLLILIGYLLYRKGGLTDASSRQLSSLIVNFCNPALLICSVLGDGPRASGRELVTGALIILCAYGILFLFGQLIPCLLKVPKKDRFAYRLLTLYGNVGFIGIPLASAVLGPGSLIYVSLNNLVYNFLIYTHGIAVIKKAASKQAGLSKQGRTLKQARPLQQGRTFAQAKPSKQGQTLTQGESQAADPTAPARQAATHSSRRRFPLPAFVNAGTVSAAVTLLLYLYHPAVPVIFSDTLDCIGRSTTFLSMLVLGVSVAQLPLREIFVHGRLYLFTLLRMILLPVGCIFLFRLFTDNELIICTTVLLLAVPAGNMPLILSKEYGVNHPTVPRGIILTTLLSLLTIPLVTLFV